VHSPVERELAGEEARALLELTGELVEKEIAPKAGDYEASARFPREVFRTLGRSGLLSLPYPEEYGGGDQPFEVYLQVIEELARGWLAVGLGVSVHTLSCHALASFGTEEQKQEWLPDMLGGELLGAYCLSEPESGSDAAALTTRAVRAGDGYVVDGTKAWITHGGVADFYSAMVRTSDDGPRGITCLLVPGDTAGVSAAQPERKMGMSSSPTAQIRFENARVPESRRIGTEGQGFPIALAALDSGRLGIAASAVGLAQAALDEALRHTAGREQFGVPLARLGPVPTMLALSWTDIEMARALTYRAAAAASRDPLANLHLASLAKVGATEAAGRVVDRSVQVMGRFGLVRGSKIERLYRESRPMRIYEGATEVILDSLAKHLVKGLDA
jgi:alkylation response protein AidB-like acyl-CoA dehydrogenase